MKTLLGNFLIDMRFNAFTFLLHFQQKQAFQPYKIYPFTKLFKDYQRLLLTSTWIDKKLYYLWEQCLHYFDIISLEYVPPYIYLTKSLSFVNNFYILSNNMLLYYYISICSYIFIIGLFYVFFIVAVNGTGFKYFLLEYYKFKNILRNQRNRL